MVRIRSGHELKPSSSSIPSQEMSDAKENDDVPVDGSNNGLKSDNTEQEESFHSVESEAGHESSKSAENGETLVDEMDIEVTAADEGTVERQSASEQFGEVVKPDAKSLSDVKSEARELPGKSNHGCEENAGPNVSTSDPESAELAIDVKNEACQVPRGKSSGAAGDTVTLRDSESVTPHTGSSVIKIESKGGEELKSKVNGKKITTPTSNGKENSKYMLLSDDSHTYDGNDSGTEEEQSDFIKELESFFKERSMEFKPLKFYGETVNCLKLYRAVTRLGGYDKVTSSKLWRQVGESFKPPRTCTTISFTFRGFYEKALLDYEKHKTHGGEISMPIPSQPKPISIENQASGSGRKRREAATRAMQGWHSKRLIGNGEVSDPIIKDKDANALPKHDKQLKTSGSHKRKKPPNVDPVVKDECTKQTKLQLDVDVSDLGTPADWVKVNVQKTKDCFEVYALVPGLLREEVRVQTDPAGRLVISGEPGHPDNPWGVTPFKKAVALPSRIDPHRTSAVVTLHGQLYVRVPFEKSE